MSRVVVLALVCLALMLAGAPHARAQASATDPALAGLIRSLTDRDAGKLAERALADGGVAIDLGSSYRQLPVARMGDAGEVLVGCVGTLAEANRFFGRDLETGVATPQDSVADIGPRARAARHGMTPWQYQFYAGLIERAAAVDPARPKAATITIVNADGAGEGFNSTAAALLPAPGNTGANLGQQRLRLFEEAARIWAAFLDSGVTIRVRANFDPLTPCTTGGGVLGFAGPLQIFRDFPNAPQANTWYAGPLANKLRGQDLDAAEDDIATAFNSSVDTGCLGAGTRYYYGFDNATPNGTINLLVVLLHELGHGLGFLSVVDSEDGTLPSGIPDVWSRLMFDRSQGLYWSAMSSAQRLQSQVNANNVLWDGASVRVASGFLTAAREGSTGRVELYTPSTLEPGSSVSHWNASASPNLLMEPAINPGLPLSLDLTRQLMRDIGWYRDTTADLVRDTITAVAPASGAFNVGSTVNITWSNTGGFNRNVTIELSTNGGTSWSSVVASNIANTGSFAWTVPNLPTTQARLRVREHDFAEPAGTSAANFTILANTAPTIFAASPVNLTRGSAAASFPVATVSDAQTPAGSLVVTQVAGGTATGISATSIVNNAGAVSAQLQADCSATGGTLRFQVSDGALASTANLSVNVAFNTAPVLGYPNPVLIAGNGTSFAPTSGPADNGSITAIAVQSAGTYTGGISVAPGTGVVTLSNVQPVGTHVLVIRATDNCGQFTDASFELRVNPADTPPVFTPVPGGLTRQQGSDAGAAQLVGTVSDPVTPAGNIQVSATGAGTATGVAVTDVVNSGGNVIARVAANCAATSGTRTFQVIDPQGFSFGELPVNVTANTPPSLGAYAAALTGVGGSATVSPATPPADNGSVASVSVDTAPAGYTGTISVAPASGVVTIGAAAPAGLWTVSVTTTDNCGIATLRTFPLEVSADVVFRDGYE
jgi:hypothetical protein